MALKPITVEGIEAGGLVETANKMLGELCEDIIKRHRMTTTRELNITIKLGPKVEEPVPGNERTFVDVDWSIKAKRPGFSSMTTRAFVQGDKVLYDDADPMKENPEQMTIFEVSRSPEPVAAGK